MIILRNARIFSNGSIRKGKLIIQDGKIKSIDFSVNQNENNSIDFYNEEVREIDCEKRLIIPGIIDIHAHLRDMDQEEKESFKSGTIAAAFSGITTVFTMPNTKPPAITANQVHSWMKKAESNIYVDVGFISGVPREIDLGEIENIVKLGVIGFKIYPHNPLSGIDWKRPENLKKLLQISSTHGKTIFIHPDWPISSEMKERIISDFESKGNNILTLHNKLKPVESEVKYIKFVLVNYKQFINESNLNEKNFPIIHFCHISCIQGYNLLNKEIESNSSYKITFEVTPHHILLSNSLKMENLNYAKVDPPLRDIKHQQYLYNQFEQGNVLLIGTDHAPHTIEEKSRSYFQAPSGFPGFETYPLLLLNKVLDNELLLSYFVKVSSENPAKVFNLKSKGFIKEGFDADLIILEKRSTYTIKGQNFKSKAKFTPYEDMQTLVNIWKVLLRGEEINSEHSSPLGLVIRT